MSSHNIVSMIINLLRNIKSTTIVLNKYSFSNDSKQRLLSNRNIAISQLKFLKRFCPEEFAYAKLLYKGNIIRFFNQGDMLTATQLTTTEPCCAPPCCAALGPSGSSYCLTNCESGYDAEGGDCYYCPGTSTCSSSLLC